MTFTHSYFDPSLKCDVEISCCDICGKPFYQEVVGCRFPGELSEAEEEHEKECVGYWAVNARGRYDERAEKKKEPILNSKSQTKHKGEKSQN